MKMFRRCSLILLFSALIFIQFVYAGTTGKISGVVVDSENKMPVPARVTIENTTMGAMANPIDGSYVILNVPPGTYNLVAELIGYNKTTRTNVLVQTDITTEANFELVSEAIKVQDQIVIGDRPDIDKYEVSSVSRITADEIKALPVTNIEGILKTQTGFVSQGGAMHVRGSRAGEMGFVDDGVMIRDQLAGYGSANMSGDQSTPISRLSMNMSAADVEDVSIMKGNYSAEYGDIAGGIIVTTRKEGSNKITKVNLRYLTDDLGSPSLNKYSFNQDRADISLSGPLPLLSDRLVPALGLKWPGEKMAYYASFSVDKYDSYYDYNNYDSPASKIDYGTEEFLGIEIPDRRVNRYSGTAKLTWKMDPNSRYKLNLRYTKDWDRAYLFDWNFLYTPETAMRLKSSTEIKSVNLSLNPPFLKDTYGEILLSEVTQTYERKPGGLTPSNFYVPLEFFESFVDANGNGAWDPAEDFDDVNGDGIFGETWFDKNLNGIFDPDPNDPMNPNIPYTDYFVDVNGNGIWDPEPFVDRNGNGRWDPAEVVNYDCYYVDVNGNGIYDDGDSVYVDQDGNGNGRYDPQLSNIYNQDSAEPFIDGDQSLGEPFTDVDGNGQYGPGDIWNPANDYDHDGKYTGPDDPWSEGIPYIDYNGNGRYDAPNGGFDYGEPYTDSNGNGRWDGVDQFLDYGFDRWAQYHYDYSRTRTIKFDLTSQVSRHHGLKTGFEFKFHSIEWQDMQYPYIAYNGADDGGPWSNIERVVEVRDTTGNGVPDEYVYQTYSKGVFRDFYTRTPKDGAFYFKDRIEYGELIADIGMRYEFFIQAREVKDSIDVIEEGLSYRRIVDTRDKWAPRIGFSFPISEKAKLMFNYGHFYQRPGFSKYYQRRTQGATAAFVFGNPNLDYEKTILYEIGVQYMLAEGYRLDVSGYYKDQYGLLNTSPEGIGVNAPEAHTNVDYARSRGLEFELEKRYGQFLAGSIKYEYTWAFGKSSSDRSDYYIRFYGGDISIKENPLDWDIRHQLTVNTTLNVNKGEHPHFGIFKLPDDWSMSAIWQYKSGQPFTPTSAYPGLGLAFNEEPEVNSKRMPATSTFDIGIDKNFQVLKMNYKFTVQIKNVFNSRNVEEIHEETGLTGSSIVYDGQIYTGLGIDKDPTFYSPGRQIQVGLSVEF